MHIYRHPHMLLVLDRHSSVANIYAYIVKKFSSFITGKIKPFIPLLLNALGILLSNPEYCALSMLVKNNRKRFMFRDFFKQKAIPSRKTEHLILKRFAFGRSMAVTMLCIY